jgi:hypothetical protein
MRGRFPEEKWDFEKLRERHGNATLMELKHCLSSKKLKVAKEY